MNILTHFASEPWTRHDPSAFQQYRGVNLKWPADVDSRLGSRSFTACLVPGRYDTESSTTAQATSFFVSTLHLQLAFSCRSREERCELTACGVCRSSPLRKNSHLEYHRWEGPVQYLVERQATGKHHYELPFAGIPLPRRHLITSNPQCLIGMIHVEEFHSPCV